jgi:phage terminase large subunit-like protein
MKLWCDELAAWRYPESYDQAMFGLRIGANPQAIITTTPRPTKIIKELVADPACVVTRGSTYDNQGFLNPAFFQQIIKKYENTRLGRQELLAQILDDNPNALWNRSLLDQHRVSAIPPLHRIVVGVDPAASDGEQACETGIVACGVGRIGADLHGYVLGDYTLRGSPLEWARAVVTAYHKHSAHRVVAEINQGGQMVEHTLRSVERTLSYRAVRAAVGKEARAEPISALYEQGRVHHFGLYPELEDQMCEWEPGQGGESPDRVDALVWAFSDLMLGKNKQGWGF